jgi:hypothetical protein
MESPAPNALLHEYGDNNRGPFPWKPKVNLTTLRMKKAIIF